MSSFVYELELKCPDCASRDIYCFDTPDLPWVDGESIIVECSNCNEDFEVVAVGEIFWRVEEG